MATDRFALRLLRPAEATARLVHEVVARFTPDVCGRVVSLSEAHYDLYLSRVRFCVEYHASRLGETELARVIERLEDGDLGAVKVRANLLRDVVLAQALQLGESRAAEVFEAEYMPVVRSIARHLGGERAVDAVENFAAELMLPREGREPKIATYQGRTSLAHWLGPVVANAWRTELRRHRPDRPVLFEPDGRESPSLPLALPAQMPNEIGQCEDLLRPIFLAAGRMLESEDRLLLKLLLLDGVPQKDVARSLGLNSGTITRRRQRAVETIFAGARRLAAQCQRPGEAEDCLGLVLAGDDAELRRGLADVLAAGLRADLALAAHAEGPPS